MQNGEKKNFPVTLDLSGFLINRNQSNVVQMTLHSSQLAVHETQ
jgi:hypothetical protein